MLRRAFIRYRSNSKSLQLDRLQHSDEPIVVGVIVKQPKITNTVDLTVFIDGSFELAIDGQIKFVSAINNWKEPTT